MAYDFGWQDSEWHNNHFVRIEPLEVDPENGAYLDSLGWAYYQQGKASIQGLHRDASEIATDPSSVPESTRTAQKSCLVRSRSRTT
jgi:hypothetical protein